MSFERPLAPQERALVRDEVRHLLSRAPAYRALETEERRELGASLETAAEALVGEELESLGKSGRANTIDLPAFIGELIGGTFQAVVDASIQQMRAYGELLGQVASSPEDFVRDTPERSSIREALAEQLRRAPTPSQHLHIRSLRRPTVVLRDPDD